ncbi:MAG: hypothetical protein O3A47_01320 [Chloroflexi bacterium]|nr:hypothetical protein [Chloroflexota bacterium]
MTSNVCTNGRTKREHASNEIARLTERISGVLLGHRPQAEIEEDLEHCRYEIERLETFGRSLALSREVLDEAVTEHHRDFAPKLNSFIEEALSVTTDARYEEVLVSLTDMTISVQLPETGNLRGIDVLSHGTQDLCFVLFRIAIANLMSRTGETIPIIMDDVFANVDSQRRAKVLDVLDRLSSQIVLFTKEEDIRAWAAQSASNNPNNKLIDI